MSVRDNYKALQEEIAGIALRSGRKPEEITLVAATKYADASALKELYEAGCRDFGETRLQAALAKIPVLPSDIRWHFIGTLQSNKAAKAAQNFFLIHSVDSVELAQKLAEIGTKRGSVVPILLQVNASFEAAKHGFTFEECREVFDRLHELPGIEIRGLMAMAALTEDEKAVRACFSRLRALRDTLNLAELSMGMSQDFRIAIEEGATILRIGTLIFKPC